MLYRKRSRSPKPSLSGSPRINISSMGSDDKQRLGLASSHPSSSSSLKSSAKSNRLWIIPAVILVIYIFSKVFHPYQSSSISQHNAGSRQSRNYLATETNQTLSDLRNPFEFCPSGSAGDELTMKYGATNLGRTRLHTGSGSRVHRVLRRAMTGLPITISVLGGSISACHGAGGDPVAPDCWPARFFDWWNSVFPHPATELTNGAMRKTDSSYYAFCHSHHVPDRTDLVILDFDSSDDNDPDFYNHFELLIRSLLLRADRPAVVVLGHFSPQQQEQLGFFGPETIHSSISQFYDVPHISIKPLLYSPYVASPDSIMALFHDMVLSNTAGHNLMADVLAAYFESMTCQTWASVTTPDNSGAPDPQHVGGAVFGGVGPRKGGDPVGHVPVGLGIGLTGGGSKAKEPNYGAVGYMLDARPPPFLTTTRPSQLKDFREVEPFCVSANDLVNPLPPSLFSDTGWHVFHPSGSHASGAGHKGTENLHYWYSTLAQSKLRIPVRLSAGDVGIYYMREPLQNAGENEAEIHCWVDDNVAGKVKIVNIADLDTPSPALRIIDRSVAKGSHNIECVLQGAVEGSVPPFKILGIFAT